jgi:hypothetical protein
LSPVWPDEAEEPESRRKSGTSVPTVDPIWTEALHCQIETLIQQYARETGQAIPAARRKPRGNKPERLAVVCWILARMPQAGTMPEAVNQLACVMEAVEEQAFRRAGQLPAAQRECKPMRVIRPLVVHLPNRILWASYSIRHVTLFDDTGAMQMQRLPSGVLCLLDYHRRARIPGLVLLDRPGAGNRSLWRP